MDYKMVDGDRVLSILAEEIRVRSLVILSITQKEGHKSLDNLVSDYLPPRHILRCRAVRILNANGITKVGQLINCTEHELSRISGISKDTIDYIKKSLSVHGLRLGM